MDTGAIFVFIFVTVILGGGAAITMGRNFANNWRPLSTVALGGLGLALGVRFLHFSLFDEYLLTLQGFLLDALVIVAFAFLGYRWRRTEQMVSQYYWLYERTGPLSWRDKTTPSGIEATLHENG